MRLWNAATGEKIAELSGHDGSSGDVAFAPDGGSYLTVSEGDKPMLHRTSP